MKEISSQLSEKSGFNYGIPVTTLLARASQNRLNYSLDIVYSLPQDSSNSTIVKAVSPSPQSDSRDSVNVGTVMKDLEEVLGTVDKTVDTLDKVCRFVRC